MTSGNHDEDDEDTGGARTGALQTHRSGFAGRLATAEFYAVDADADPDAAFDDEPGDRPPGMALLDVPTVTLEALGAQWTRVRSRLQQEVGEAEFRQWLRHMTLGAIDGDEITICLPTRFMRDWVRSHYGDRLRALWQAENPGIRRVDVRVGTGRSLLDGLAEPPAAPRNGAAHPPVPQAAAPFTDVTDPPRGELPRGEPPRGDERAEARIDLAAALDGRFTFESFVVGKPNEFAHACARRVAEHPATPGFNPLFLYGGVGLGKTHLMHAVAWELSTRGARASVVYLSAEKFMYRFISALRTQSTMEFKEQLRSVDVLMIDDLQFLMGKESTQEEFFHTFNALVDAGKQIVVSADKSPSDLSGLPDRLRTRLGCGMVADLHATTFELRMAIMEAKAAGAGTAVPPKVLEFLAHKIPTNVRELEGALNRLIAHAGLFNRPITLETTQEVLHDLLKAHDRRVTIEEIQKRVSEHYSVRVTEMTSARRARAVARPRQVAMFLAKQLTTRSLPEIGRMFGNRDHTTVMHAVARITALMAEDPNFAEDVEMLRRLLSS